MNGAEFAADRGISIQKWTTIAGGGQPVSGLGDAAFWDASLQTLDVAKGDFFLSLFGLDPRKQYEFKLDPLKTLAQKSLSRLPAAAPVAAGASPAGSVTSARASSAGSTSVPAGAAACSLATAANVATAYGEPFEPGRQSSPGGQSACLFVPSCGGVDSVGLTVVSGPQADIFYSSNRTAFEGADVAGLGDKAFIVLGHAA